MRTVRQLAVLQLRHLGQRPARIIESDPHEAVALAGCDTWSPGPWRARASGPPAAGWRCRRRRRDSASRDTGRRSRRQLTRPSESAVPRWTQTSRKACTARRRIPPEHERLAEDGRGIEVAPSPRARTLPDASNGAGRPGVGPSRPARVLMRVAIVTPMGDLDESGVRPWRPPSYNAAHDLVADRHRVHRRADPARDRRVREAGRGPRLRVGVDGGGARRRPVRHPGRLRRGHAAHPSRHQHQQRLRAQRAHHRHGRGDRGRPLGRPLHPGPRARATASRSSPSTASRSSSRSSACARRSRSCAPSCATAPCLAPGPRHPDRALRPLVHAAAPRDPHLPGRRSFRPCWRSAGEIAQGVILTWSTLEAAAARGAARGGRRAPSGAPAGGRRDRLAAAVRGGAEPRGGARAAAPVGGLYAGFFPRYNRLMAESGFAEAAARHQAGVGHRRSRRGRARRARRPRRRRRRWSARRPKCRDARRGVSGRRPRPAHHQPAPRRARRQGPRPWRRSERARRDRDPHAARRLSRRRAPGVDRPQPTHERGLLPGGVRLRHRRLDGLHRPRSRPPPGARRSPRSAWRRT